MNASHLFPVHDFQRLARMSRRLLSFALRGSGWQRNAFALMDQAVVSLASFGTAIVLGRFGSRAELGTYALALTILMLMVNVQGELITAPYILFRQRRNELDIPQYTGSIVLHELVYICVAVLTFALLLVGIACGIGPTSLHPLLCVLMFAAPFWLLRAFIRYTSFANLQFATAFAVDTVTAVLQLSLMLLLLTTDRLNAANTYAVMGASCAIACCGWWFARRLPIQFVVPRVWRDFVGNWSFSRWALASQLVGCITPYLLPWILAHARGEAETGTFAACTNLCGIATMFVVGLAHALTPQAARAYACGGQPALLRILSRTAALFVAGVGIFCVLMAWAGELAMTSIYGPSFAGTQWVVSLLALGVLTNSFAIVFGNGLWAVNRPAANLIADLTILLATLLAAALLIQPLGIMGAAISTLVGSAAGAVTRGIVFRHVLREARLPAAASTLST